MSRFKAGDLALIVGSASGYSKSVGKFVELIEPVIPGGTYKINGRTYLLNESNSAGAGWKVKGDLVSVNGFNGFCLVAERHLMPLRGNFTPEEMREMEKENA